MAVVDLGLGLVITIALILIFISGVTIIHAEHRDGLLIQGHGTHTEDSQTLGLTLGYQYLGYPLAFRF
jgi:hypothetical protein